MVKLWKRHQQPQGATPQAQQSGMGSAYQIYESAQPKRTHRWLLPTVLIAVSVIVLVGVVFGGVKLYRNLSDRYSGSGSQNSPATKATRSSNGDTSASGSSARTNRTQPQDVPQQTQQAPQNNNAIPKPDGQPVAVPQENTTNNGTVTPPN